MMARFPQTLRWGIYFSLALGLHGAGAAALLSRWNDSPDLVANAPLIMIDLAPVAVAPTITPTEMPPDVVESKLVEPVPEPELEPEPEKPIEKVELPPDPAPQPELTAMPPPKPIEKKVEKKKKPRQRQASIARAPSAADRRSERAAAPTPGANARDSNAVPSWKSRLVAQIERNKRYPAEAQYRREQGVAQVAFSIDRSGGVHNVRVVRSSGSSILDRDAIAWLERAQPLPPPPPEMPGAQIPLSVPLRYNLR